MSTKNKKNSTTKELEMANTNEPAAEEVIVIEENETGKNDDQDKEKDTTPEIVPPLLVSPSLDTVGFWNKYVSFGCSFELLKFTVGLPRALRSCELWEPPTEDKIQTLAAKFDEVFDDPYYTTEYKQNNNGKPYPHSRRRYLMALWAGCKFPLLLSAFFSFVRICCELGTPFLTNYFVTAVKNRDFEGLYYAIGIVACLTVVAISQQQQLRFGELALNRCRSVTNYVIFRKAMRIRNSVGIASSEIAVISSQDTQRFIDIAPFFQLLWASPVQIIVGGVLMYSFLGVVGLFALAVLSLLYPLIFVIGRLQVIVRRNYSASNSLRILLISEFLQGVNVVKMYGWEHFMKERILKARNDELRSTRQELYLWAITSVNMICFPTVTIALAFLLYVHVEGRLEAADAFATLSLVSILKFPIMNFGTAFMSMMQLMVGCGRIGDILAQELPTDDAADSEAIPVSETERQKVLASLADGKKEKTDTNKESKKGGKKEKKKSASDEKKRASIDDKVSYAKSSGITIIDPEPFPGALALEMNNLYAFWKRPSEEVSQKRDEKEREKKDVNNKKKGDADKEKKEADTAAAASSDEPTFVLKNVNLSVRIGEVCAVTGVVGAGKSMLCLTALGETHIANGSCAVARQGGGGSSSSSTNKNGPIAYCSQESFLLSGTIRDNILFHEPFDAQRYLEVLEVCCLWPDFDQYEDGEMTIVGERGITLSGGQKARIALARAVYAKNVSLMVIDDPFSALDAGTTKKISSALLSRKHGYLRDRAVLLVTHNRQIVAKYADHVLTMDDGNTHSITDLDAIANAMLEDNNSITSQTQQQHGVDGQHVIDAALAKTTTNDGNDDAATEKRTKSQVPDSSSDEEEEDLVTKQRSEIISRANTAGSDADDDQKQKKGDSRQPTSSGSAPNPFLTKHQLDRIDAKRHRLDDVTKNKLVKDELFEPLVTLKSFARYFYHGGGYWTIPLVIIFLGIERACFIGCDYWLSQWTTASASTQKPDTYLSRTYGFGPAYTTDEAMWYWKVYIVIVVITYILGFNRLNWLAVVGTRVARNLFQDAFVQMLRCPMLFFDTTPTGRIVNRFSHDTDRIAYPLVIAMNGITATQGWVVSAVVVIAFIMPYTLLVSLPGVITIYVLAFTFRSINAHLQRLDAASRSNLQAHIYESLYGSVVVRAYGKSEQVLEACTKLADDNTRSLYAVTLTQRWVSLRAELLGALVGGLVAIFLWIVRYDVSPGLAGMAVTWGINLSRSSSFTVADGVQADARLVSVDRLCEFRDDLIEEPPMDRGIKDKEGRIHYSATKRKSDNDSESKHDDKKAVVNHDEKKAKKDKKNKDKTKSEKKAKNANAPDSATAPSSSNFLPLSTANTLEDFDNGIPQPDADNWPIEGRISFKGVQMRYRPGMPLVLNGATFEVPPGHRVGVIGRTGSGKSSLVQCLFRLREIEGGSICIDGLDIASVGLAAVRGSRMSIIPQDPVLFSGTVRTNVDPFSRYTDKEVTDALKAVSLWARVEREGGLSATVAERGSNFSVGQKQLVCIARAVLRQPTILVMDEATANVDHETDELIQKKVRELFATTTIFEIAHRLHTVADADLIVVMDRGVVGEIGPPEELLANPSSHFSQLVEASGPVVAEELKEIVAKTAATRTKKHVANA